MTRVRLPKIAKSQFLIIILTKENNPFIARQNLKIKIVDNEIITGEHHQQLFTIYRDTIFR